MKAVPRRMLVLGGGPVGVEMAQAVRRFGGEVALIEGAPNLLPREARPLGEALAEVLRRDGIELFLGVTVTAARREADEYVIDLDAGGQLRGDRLLVATGRRPRVDDIGLETVGVQADGRGVPVDSRLRAGERLWAIGDVTGIWPLTHVGKYQGDVVAANILGEPREADYDAVPRVVFTDPQAAATGATDGRFSGTARLSELAEDRDLHPRVRRQQRVPDPARRRGAADRGVRARTRGWRVASAGDAGDSRPRTDRGSQRHDPAIPDLLRDLPRGTQVTARADRRHPAAKGDGGEMNAMPAVADPTQRQPRENHGDLAALSPAQGQRDLLGQTLLVIGGSAGIGLETARLAREQGAEVILTARNPDPLHRAGLELGASIAAFDATDFDRLKRFFDELPTPIDHVLVTGPGPHYAPFAEFDIDDLRRDVEAHLFLPLQIARNAVGKVRPGGTLLFMGGTGGRRTAPGLYFLSALTAALPALTKNLALELAPIRVNVIAAGFVDTPLSATLLGDQLDARREQLRNTLPIGRVVEPADVAALAIHLMTNSTLTGATFDIDGGQQLVGI